MDRLLLVIGGFSAVLVVLVLASVRRQHIRVEYSVSWLVAATVLMVVSFNRDIVDWMAAALQIAYPPLVVLALMFGVFLVVLYRLSLRISELKDNNIALAQKLAILEYRHNALHEEYCAKAETKP